MYKPTCLDRNNNETMKLYQECNTVSKFTTRVCSRCRRGLDPRLLNADGGAVLQEAPRVRRDLHRERQRPRHRCHVHFHQRCHKVTIVVYLHICWLNFDFQNVRVPRNKSWSCYFFLDKNITANLMFFLTISFCYWLPL